MAKLASKVCQAIHRLFVDEDGFTNLTLRIVYITEFLVLHLLTYTRVPVRSELPPHVFCHGSSLEMGCYR